MIHQCCKSSQVPKVLLYLQVGCDHRIKTIKQVDLASQFFNFELPFPTQRTVR